VQPLVVLKLKENHNQCTAGDILFACNGCTDPVILRPSGTEYTFVHTTFCIPPGTIYDRPDSAVDICHFEGVAQQFESGIDRATDDGGYVEVLEHAMGESELSGE
jgi:hypothetical protein